MIQWNLYVHNVPIAVQPALIKMYVHNVLIKNIGHKSLLAAVLRDIMMML